MKFSAVEIVGFGKWQQKRIDFSAENQLFYGPNEIGKSTLYQFIQAMLFGFPTKGKRKRDYQPKDGAAYGGRLWLIHPVYGEVRIERFKAKNKGQAILYFEQGTGDEARLKELLHPLTKELFQSVFTFQQEQLSQLDKLTEEQLQTALLSLGVSGSQQLLVHRDQYFKDAQSLYKRKGTQPPLNQTLKAYHYLQQQIHEKEQQEYSFQQLLIEIEQVQQTMAENKNRLLTLKDQLEKIDTQIRHLPLLEELTTLDSVAELPTITHQEQEELQDAYQQYRFLADERIRLNQVQAHAATELGSVEEYQFYLTNQPLINQLLEQRYSIEQLVAEAKWMTDSLYQNEQELNQLAKRWGWSKEQAPQFPFEEQEVQQLWQKHQEQLRQLQKAQTTSQLLEEEITTREKNLTTFELLNKEMFQKQHQPTAKKVNLPVVLIGILLLFISFILPTPIRYVILCLGFVSGVVGLLPLVYQRKDSFEEEKKQWQEKLSQLDHLNDQLVAAKNEQQALKEHENEQQKRFNQTVRDHHLGEMRQLEDWLNHRSDITRFLLLQKTNQELEQQVVQQQKQVTAMVQQTEPLSERLPIASSPLSQRMQTIQAFADRMEKIRFAQEYQADTYTQQSIREINEKQRQVTDAIHPLLYKLKIESINQIPVQLDQYRQGKSVQQRKEELQQLLAGVYQEAEQPAMLQARQKQLIKENQQVESQLVQQQQKEQELLFKKQQMTIDGTLDELYQRQAELQAQMDEQALEWTSNCLAGQLLMDLLTELSDQQLPLLLQHASEYIQLLTNQGYQAVALEEGQVVLIRKDQQRFFIQEVSTGTKDQVIMAFRFAYLVMQTHPMCPVIIDDGWLHYDSQRKAQLAKLFVYFSKKQQVICFSSDQEMVSYYQELNQPIIELKGV